MTATPTPSADLAVVGGGLIGLSIAWRAAQAGLTTTLLEREAELGLGASHYAAGMLAPVSEAEIGHAGLLQDGLAAAAMWPEYARELSVPLLKAGTLHVARDLDEAVALERELAFRERQELPVTRLLPSDARKLEPGLAPNIRFALHIPDEQAVDPRAVIEALEQKARDFRVRITLNAPVTAIAHGNGFAEPQTQDGRSLRARMVVLAGGAWSPALMPGLEVRPVKGQILRLRDPGHATTGPLISHVLRFAGGYLVPRGDGRYVLGATVEDKGFDQTVTAGGVYELLRDAGELVPGISELVIEETGAGLRPGSPQNLPIVERRGRVLVATGHYRNGVLLAPLTAQRVVQQIIDDRSSVPA